MPKLIDFNTMDTRKLYWYRYWFYGFIGYYIVVALIILQAMVGNTFANPFFPIISYLYDYPLITMKKLQGYPQVSIQYYIKPYEGFLLILLYGILVGFICQLFFSWRNRKKQNQQH